jgi:hypothetical protein
MKIPFLSQRIDMSSYESVRRHATYLPSAEAAWPIRGDGTLRSHEESMAKLERMRRHRAAAYPEDT